MTAPTNLILTRLLSGIRLNWTCSGSHETEIYVSIDDADYTLLDTVDEGVLTYDDITDYLGHTVKYKLRSKGAVTTSAFSNSVNDILEFVFTSKGDGSGVGTLNFEVSVDVVATIDGDGKFYTNAEATEGESSSWSLTSTGSGFNGNLNRIYIKVPSGQSTLRIKNVITKWGEAAGGGSILNDGWSTPNPAPNHPEVRIDASKLTHNQSYNLFGRNFVFGDITAQDIIYIEIANGYHDGYITTELRDNEGCQMTGDVTGWDNLKCLDSWDNTHFTGSLTGKTSLKTIWIGGNNAVTGDLSGCTSLVTVIVYPISSIYLSGDISACSSMSYIDIHKDNDIIGSISGMTNLRACHGVAVSAANVTNLKLLCWLDLSKSILTSANVNQILADIWANRDEAKIENTRTITLNGTGSGAPTGQGITDKANLQAYRTPNNDPTKPLWTINTL